MSAPVSVARPEHWNAAIQAVSDWIIRQALRDARIGPLFEGLCERLVDCGLPLVRANLALPTLHPMFESMTVTWWRGEGVRAQQIPHGEGGGADWLRSPLHHMMEHGLPSFRCRLQAESVDAYPILKEFSDRGLTDYFAMITPFRDAEEAVLRRDGMLSSWTTGRPDGFHDDEIAALRRLQLRLGLAVKVALREQTANNVVSAYLGPDAGRRVLDGQIRLGDGDLIHAVVWYNDLRDSTGLADRTPPADFLAALNAYFACTAGAVLDHGGQVLRFIGDAVLAIFSTDGPGGAAGAARTALIAARDAERRVAALNTERRGRGEAELGFGLGLHVGEVMFGNIGVPERVEFSVIGAIANEVCRLEGLTKELGETIVVSDDFARCLPLDWRSLGRHRLRGVGDDQEILVPPDRIPGAD